MDIGDLLLHFLGGALLANGVPHFVHGISGHRFQTPFARPPGRGESPPVTNLLWGFANLAVGWLVLRTPDGDAARTPEQQAAVAVGALAMGVALAWWFGKVRGGGDRPRGDRLGR